MVSKTKPIFFFADSTAHYCEKDLVKNITIHYVQLTLNRLVLQIFARKIERNRYFEEIYFCKVVLKSYMATQCLTQFPFLSAKTFLIFITFLYFGKKGLNYWRILRMIFFLVLHIRPTLEREVSTTNMIVID